MLNRDRFVFTFSVQCTVKTGLYHSYRSPWSLNYKTFSQDIYTRRKINKGKFDCRF